VLAGALLFCSAVSARAQAERAAETAALLPLPPQMQADGLPPITRLLKAPPGANTANAANTAANDAEPPAHRLLGWHPQRAELLILTRRGPTAQLHSLAGPGDASTARARTRPTALTRGPEAIEGARWEPSSANYLVLRRDQGGDEAWRLYRLAASGGDAVRISPAQGRVAAYQFLPAGRGLVYLHERVDRDDPSGERAAHSRLVWVDPLQPQHTQMLADVPQGRLFNLAVSAAGDVLVTRSQQGRTTRLRWPARAPGADAQADRPTGAPTEAAAAASTASTASPSAPNAEPETVIEREGSLRADEDSLWGVQAVRGDFRHAVRSGVLSGQRQFFLTEVAADLELLAAPAAGRSEPLAVVHNDQGLSSLRLWDPAQPAQPARWLPVGLPAGVIRSVQWHPRLPLLAIDHVSAQSPGRVFVYDHAAGTLVDWSGTTRDGTPLDFTTLRWPSFDGLAISALHVSPPASFSGRRPVLINLHGGPASQARPGYLSPTHRHLVERLGMHLVMPNVRGSSGFGRRFLALDDGRLREDALKDVSALLDHLASRSDVDMSKIVVEGGSYGGYLSMAVAAQESARIAGSICRVGIANFVSFLQQTESYRRDNRRAEYGDERDPAMREFLIRISPLSRAAQIKKPLFIVHGRNDPRVPYNEAEQMAQAVRAGGTPVWFLTAEDEGHSISHADSRDYVNAATVQFVRRLVEGRPLN
jgi:dipeptidyl aminopeptidase/acylaminoacyl peptidase